MTNRPRALAVAAVAAFAIVAGCSRGDTGRPAPSGLLPTTPTATSQTFVDPAAAQFGALAVSLPSPQDALLFRQVLEAKLQADGRPLQTTYVNAEGAIVWTLEYLRFRMSGCSQAEAIDRVFAQIDRVAAPPLCGTAAGAGSFPPANESLAFRQALEAKYRDGLGAPALQTYIDLQSDVIYTLEFVRYSQSGCSSAEAYERVFVQIDGRGVAPDCRVPPPATCTFSLSPTPQPVLASGGTFTGTVTAEPDTCRWQISADAPWVTGAARAALGTQGFTYVVAANDSAQARRARITLTGDDDGRATLDINQAASTAPPPPPPPPQPPPPPACTYAVSPTSIATDGHGGTFDIQVTTGPSCPWSASTPGGFVQVLSGQSAVGTGSAKINVLRNLGPPRRGSFDITWPTGTVTIAVSQRSGPPIAVIKAPASCDVFGDSCLFDGSQSEGPITQWLWDFGDDGTGEGPTSGSTVNHDYSSSWFFEFEESFVSVVVRLTVIGPYGSDSATATVRIFSSDLFVLMHDE